MMIAAMHTLPHFDKELFTGEGGSLARANIERYDFRSFHSHYKSENSSFDIYLLGANEPVVLFWFADLECARAGWAKLINAWKEIGMLVASGERSWHEYALESVFQISLTPSSMLAAGDMVQLREWLLHSFTGRALREPLLKAELKHALEGLPMWWQDGPDDYCFCRFETLMLQTRALAIVAGVGYTDHDADGDLRSWLPPVEALIYIAQRERAWNLYFTGAAHPSLLCATLYATRLEEWAKAAAVATAMLAIPGYKSQPMVRIECFRLLARCETAVGDAPAAADALEKGLSEAREVGYVWMETMMETWSYVAMTDFA